VSFSLNILHNVSPIPEASARPYDALLLVFAALS
jgi:hypothetical protein